MGGIDIRATYPHRCVGGYSTLVSFRLWMLQRTAAAKDVFQSKLLMLLDKMEQLFLWAVVLMFEHVDNNHVEPYLQD